ncbi:MAG TPA: TetR/AcrR family transcriptional regulator [Vicinamibacterales bacterium]|nr:TetR/AcrR family transcriptional regulator [Vicinamibacterales bacterium]
MVKAGKKTEAATGTRELILAAAIQEFAGKGFDGAKVDRIAERAGVNKAMLYYHFHNKAALYLEILREQFSSVADAVEAVRAAGGSPVDQIRHFTAAIARQALARPHFPHMWLREIADGGRHVDASVIMQFRRVLAALGAILAEGQKAGVFRKADPLVVQISLVAPLMFFAASAPLRERAAQLAPPSPPLPGLDAVIEHVQAATLAILCVEPPRKAPTSTSRRPSR